MKMYFDKIRKINTEINSLNKRVDELNKLKELLEEQTHIEYNLIENIKGCVICGRGGEIHNHHLFPDHYTDTNYIVALCSACHGWIHNVYRTKAFQKHHTAKESTINLANELEKLIFMKYAFGLIKNRSKEIKDNPEKFSFLFKDNPQETKIEAIP